MYMDGQEIVFVNFLPTVEKVIVNWNHLCLAFQMALIFNEEGLQDLTQAPCVVQQFVNHDAVLFKVSKMLCMQLNFIRQGKTWGNVLQCYVSIYMRQSKETDNVRLFLLHFFWDQNIFICVAFHSITKSLFVPLSPW